MDWIHNYQLFLFDFDGLLINTEALHLESYRRMCEEHGIVLDLDLTAYHRVAHFEATGPRRHLYATYPQLKAIDWELLRKRKNEIYLEILALEGVSLMEGVEELLLALDQAGIKRCVVTHSRPEQIEPIKKKHPVLNTIPRWLTRPDYQNAKPDPECYLKAKALFAGSSDRVIGFEDSPRGLQALLGAGVEAVMVTPYFTKDEVEGLLGKGFHHVRRMNDIKDIMPSLSCP